VLHVLVRSLSRSKLCVQTVHAQMGAAKGVLGKAVDALLTQHGDSDGTTSGSSSSSSSSSSSMHEPPFMTGLYSLRGKARMLEGVTTTAGWVG
jgi:hypothetical protein